MTSSLNHLETLIKNCNLEESSIENKLYSVLGQAFLKSITVNMILHHKKSKKLSINLQSNFQESMVSKISENILKQMNNKFTKAKLFVTLGKLFNENDIGKIQSIKQNIEDHFTSKNKSNQKENLFTSDDILKSNIPGNKSNSDNQKLDKSSINPKESLNLTNISSSIIQNKQSPTQLSQISRIQYQNVLVMIDSQDNSSIKQKQNHFNKPFKKKSNPQKSKFSQLDQTQKKRKTQDKEIKVSNVGWFNELESLSLMEQEQNQRSNKKSNQKDSFLSYWDSSIITNPSSKCLTNADMNKNSDLAIEKYGSFKPSNIQQKGNSTDKSIVPNPFLNSSSTVIDLQVQTYLNSIQYFSTELNYFTQFKIKEARIQEQLYEKINKRQWKCRVTFTFKHYENNNEIQMFRTVQKGNSKKKSKEAAMRNILLQIFSKNKTVFREWKDRKIKKCIIC